MKSADGKDFAHDPTKPLSPDRHSDGLRRIQGDVTGQTGIVSRLTSRAADGPDPGASTS